MKTLYKIILLMFTINFSLFSSSYAQEWIITPQKGVGPIHIGDNIKSTFKFLGKYDEKVETPMGVMYHFYEEGITLIVNSDNLLREITIDKPYWKSIKMKTAKGVTVGTYIDVALKKIGTPLKARCINKGQNMWVYTWKGLIIGSFQGKVKYITITK